LNNKLTEIKKAYGVKLIYIFGSYAKGTNNEKSDIDIAVLLANDFNPLDKVNLLGDFCDFLKRDDVDLAILNSANSVLKHQIIKYGKLIYMEDEVAKVTFESRTLKEYMDMEYFRKTQMYYINQWVKKELEG
jgi:predicted nucleotidyltransferase